MRRDAFPFAKFENGEDDSRKKKSRSTKRSRRWWGNRWALGPLSYLDESQGFRIEYWIVILGGGASASGCRDVGGSGGGCRGSGGHGHRLLPVHRRGHPAQLSKGPILQNLFYFLFFQPLTLVSRVAAGGPCVRRLSLWRKRTPYQ